MKMTLNRFVVLSLAALFLGKAGAEEVTNLNNDGEGSLRWAIERTSARTITFAESVFNGKASASLCLNGPITVANDRIVTVCGPADHELSITTDAVIANDGSDTVSKHHFIVRPYASLSLENLTLSNGCHVDPNELAGGGSIFLDAGTLITRNCAFRANLAGAGGAVFLRKGAKAHFRETSFQDNAAPLGGGAVMLEASSSSGWNEAFFQNCTFVGNRSEQAAGGAIRAASGTRVEISRCTFYGNAGKNGASVYLGTGNSCLGGASRIDDTVAVGSINLNGGSNDMYFRGPVTGSGNWFGCVWDPYFSSGFTFVQDKTVAETFATTEPVPVGGYTQRVVMPVVGELKDVGDETLPLDYEVLRADGTCSGLSAAVWRQCDDTLTLLRDVTIPSGQLPAFRGKVLLNGNGHTLTLAPQNLTETRRILSVGTGSLTLTNITMHLEGDEKQCLMFISDRSSLVLENGVVFENFSTSKRNPLPYAFRTRSSSQLTIRSGVVFRNIQNLISLTSPQCGSLVVEKGVTFENCSFGYSYPEPEPEPPVVLEDPVAKAWTNLSAVVSARIESARLDPDYTNTLSRLFEDLARTNETAVAADRLVACSNLVLSVIDYLSFPIWREGCYYTSLSNACADGTFNTKVYVLRPYNLTETLVESSGVTVSGATVAFTNASCVALSAFPESERAGIGEAVASLVSAVAECQSRQQGQILVPGDIVGFEVKSENAFTLRELSLSTAGGAVRTQPFITIGKEIGKKTTRFTSYKLMIEGEVSDGSPLINVCSNATATLSDVFISGCTNSTANVGAITVEGDGVLFLAGRTSVIDNFAANRPCNVKLADAARLWPTGGEMPGRIGISGIVEPGMEFGSSKWYFVPGRCDAAFVNDNYPDLAALVDGDSIRWRSQERPDDWVSLGYFPEIATNETVELNGEYRRMTAVIATADETDASVPLLTVPTGAVVRISNLELDVADSGWRSFFSVEPGGELILSNVTVRGFAGSLRSPMRCRNGRLQLAHCVFTGFNFPDLDLLDLVSYPGNAQVEIADSVFSNNICRAVAYSSNGTRRSDAHRFLNTQFTDNVCEYDFILAYGATYVDGTRMDHELKTLVATVNAVAKGKALPDPRYVFTNAVPASGICLDTRDLEGLDGQCVVGNERNCPLAQEKVSFAVTSVVCSVKAETDGSLVFHSAFKLPAIPPPPASGVSCRLQQVVSGMGVLFVYENGATNAVHGIVQTNREVVVKVPYTTTGGQAMVLTNYICYIDIEDSRIYVPDAQHGGISTYYMTTDRLWKPLSWGCQLPEDMLSIETGDVVLRFGEDESDIRCVSCVSIPIDYFLMIVGCLLDTEEGREFAKNHPDYSTVEKFHEKLDEAEKKKSGHVVGNCIGGLLGLGVLGLGIGTFNGGLGAGLALEAIAGNIGNILDDIFGNRGNNNNRNNHGNNDHGNDGDNEGGGEGGEEEEGPQNVDNRSNPQKIADQIAKLLTAKDLADAVYALYQLFLARQYYHGLPYTDMKPDYKKLLEKNKSNHGKEEKEGEVILWIGAQVLPLDNNDVVKDVFLCYDSSIDISTVFSSLFYDSSGDHNRAYSITSDAMIGASLILSFEHARRSAASFKGALPGTLKGMWSTLVSLAANLLKNLVHYSQRKGFFDMPSGDSYRVGSGGDVCLQNMRFGCSKFKYDDWQANRSAPLMKVEEGGILEIKSTTFDGYRFDNGSTPLILVENGGTLILCDAEITDCGACPVVVNSGGQVWVSGDTKVELQVEDKESLRIGRGPRGLKGAWSESLTAGQIVCHGLTQVDTAFAQSAFSSASGWNLMKASGYEDLFSAEVSDGYAYWRFSDSAKKNLTPTFSLDGRLSIEMLKEAARISGKVSNSSKGYVYSLVGSKNANGTYTPISGATWTGGANSEHAFSYDVPCGESQPHFFRISVTLPK